MLKYRVIDHQSTTQLSFKFLFFFVSFKPCQPYNFIDAKHIKKCCPTPPSEVLRFPLSPSQPLGSELSRCWTFPSSSQGLCSDSGNCFMEIRPLAQSPWAAADPSKHHSRGIYIRPEGCSRTHITPLCRGEFHPWVLHIVGSGLTSLVIKGKYMPNKQKKIIVGAL